MIVERVYISPLDSLPKLSKPSVLRPELNDPNRVTTVGGYKICVPQVPPDWEAMPIPYIHDNRIAFEYPYWMLLDKAKVFLFPHCVWQ